VTEKIMQLIGRDINGETSEKRGREGMDYWVCNESTILQSRGTHPDPEKSPQPKNL